MPYRIEISPNNRAGCKNTECQKNNDKILKGTLRFATLVEIQERQSWAYKHWGCVTPQQISNVNRDIDGKLDYLDGYDELPSDLQEKVRTALERGHVDDEDWKGDIEMNRPGKKGFRSPAAKKKKKKKAEAEEDDETGSPSPSKPAPKKRGRAKADEGGTEGDDEKPAAKKAKASGRPGKKSQVDEANGNESEDGAPQLKRARGKSKRTKAEGDEGFQPIKGEEEEEEEAPKTAVKKTRAPRKAAEAKSIKHENDEDGFDSEEPEVPKPKRMRKKSSGDGANGTAKATTDEKAGTKGAKKGPRKGSQPKSA